MLNRWWEEEKHETKFVNQEDNRKKSEKTPPEIE